MNFRYSVSKTGSRRSLDFESNFDLKLLGELEKGLCDICWIRGANFLKVALDAFDTEYGKFLSAWKN